MVLLNEDISCYSSPAQRPILIRFTEHPLVREHFFLTGGTALSVFFLHHRTSEDLDFFAVDPVDLSELSFWIRTVWQTEHAIVRNTAEFLTVMVRDVKVDFVIDALSDRTRRERARFGQYSMMIDTLSNIAANKLCTVVSRNEPKDFVDLYVLMKQVPQLDFESTFEAARKREALFDDPPTAAYQLERSLRFVRDRPELLPQLRIPLELKNMFAFYEGIAKTLYEKAKMR
jgi:hypothetical protein